MRIHQERLVISTSGPGLYPVTRAVAEVVTRADLDAGAVGLCTVFIRHTSASLVIQENADETVRKDLVRFFHKLVPEGKDYEHDAEGPDDMPAHIKAALTQTSLGIPLVQGRLGLGTWQGIYVWEHRRAQHERELIVQVLAQEMAQTQRGPTQP